MSPGDDKKMRDFKVSLTQNDRFMRTTKNLTIEQQQFIFAFYFLFLHEFLKIFFTNQPLFKFSSSLSLFYYLFSYISITSPFHKQLPENAFVQFEANEWTKRVRRKKISSLLLLLEMRSINEATIVWVLQRARLEEHAHCTYIIYFVFVFLSPIHVFIIIPVV